MTVPSEEIGHTADYSTDKLANEVAEYAAESEDRPSSVTKELPRLLEILDVLEIGEDEVDIEGDIYHTIINIAESNPDSLSDIYPDLVENSLSHNKSKILTRRIIHKVVDFHMIETFPDTPPQKLCEFPDSELINLNKFADELNIGDLLPANGATAITVAEKLSKNNPGDKSPEQVAFDIWEEAYYDLAAHEASKQGLSTDAVVDLSSLYKSEGTPLTKGFFDGEIRDMIDENQTTPAVLENKFATDSQFVSQLIIIMEEEISDILRTEAVIDEHIRE